MASSDGSDSFFDLDVPKVSERVSSSDGEEHEESNSISSCHTKISETDGQLNIDSQENVCKVRQTFNYSSENVDYECTAWAPTSLPKNKNLSKRYLKSKHKADDERLSEEFENLMHALSASKRIERQKENHPKFSGSDRFDQADLSYTSKPVYGKATKTVKFEKMTPSSELLDYEAPDWSIEKELLRRCGYKIPPPTLEQEHSYKAAIKFENKPAKLKNKFVPAKNEPDEQDDHSGKESRERPGVVVDDKGILHSDCNFKNITNVEVKQWLKDKEKLLKAQRKEKQKIRRKKLEEKKKESQQKDERKIESQKKLKEWQKSKTKLLRRQKLSQKILNENEPSKLFVEQKVCQRPSSANPVKQKSFHRPMSAPAKKQADAEVSCGASQAKVLHQLIKIYPDLKEKHQKLEKQKKLKYRQSYEDWCKTKEKEQKDRIKLFAEQRKKLEAEISDETARLITETARKRIDGIRFKSFKSDEETATDTNKDCKCEEQPKPPYTWHANRDHRFSSRTESEAGKPNPDKAPFLSKNKSTKVNAARNESKHPEEKINLNQPNPFQDPFSPPKLRRPKSSLEENGIKGKEFSKFVWNLVNEAEGTRPEPQGEDAPTKTSESFIPKPPSTEKPRRTFNTQQSQAQRQPEKPTFSSKLKPESTSVDSGKNIFSLTSIEL